DRERRIALLRDAVLNGENPHLALHIADQEQLPLPEPVLFTLLDIYAKSVTLRTMMLKLPHSLKLRQRIVSELARLPQENPIKVLNLVSAAGAVSAYAAALPWRSGALARTVSRAGPLLSSVGMGRLRGYLERSYMAHTIARQSHHGGGAGV